MKNPRAFELTVRQRTIGTVFAVVLMLLAFMVLYHPPAKSVTEVEDSTGEIRATKDSQDSTTPFLALFLGGLFLFVFSLNGIRFDKISAAGVSAEVSGPGEAAQEFYGTPKGDRTEEEVTVQDKEAPQPVDPPISYVERDDGRYAIYSLEALPAPVLGDALAKWPGEDKPGDLGSFEFASRKTGKGNHPWTVKFQGKRAVTVSYGGHGKTDATVSPQE